MYDYSNCMPNLVYMHVICVLGVHYTLLFTYIYVL